MVMVDWLLDIDKNANPIQGGVSPSGKAVSFSVTEDGKLDTTTTIDWNINTNLTEIWWDTVEQDNGRLTVGNIQGIQPEYKSPDDFTASYTSATTITLAATPFTVTDSHLVYIKVTSALGVVSLFRNWINGVSMTIAAWVLTISGASPFVVGDTYEVWLSWKKKAYDNLLDSQKTITQNPAWADYDDVNSETFTNLTIVLATNTYYKLIANEWKRALDLQLVGSTWWSWVVFKIYETLDPTATVTATGWTPDTTVWSDSSVAILWAATVTLDGGASDTYHKTQPTMPTYYMISYTVDNATNSTTIRSRVFN